jgi:hypothetical protein
MPPDDEFWRAITGDERAADEPVRSHLPPRATLRPPPRLVDAAIIVTSAVRDLASLALEALHDRRQVGGREPEPPPALFEDNETTDGDIERIDLTY